MDWKITVWTFGLVFLAELGDKTQLATLSLASAQSARWAVFIGAALALITTSAVAVLLGEGLSRLVPAIWLKRAAGASFLVLGAIFILQSRS